MNNQVEKSSLPVRRKKPARYWIGRFLILLVTVFVFLIALELLVRKFKPQIAFIDARTLTFDCFANDPILPFTLGKNYKCTMMDYLGDFKTFATLNSLGYRGNEFSIEKKPGTFRILILGDSITFGHGVPDDQTYPYQLEQMLKAGGYSNVEVINAGYADGFSPDTYYLYLKDRGLKLNPDLVIMGFFALNDINDLSETRWDTIDGDKLPTKISSIARVVEWRILRNRHFTVKYRFPILRDSHLYILIIDTLQKRLGWFLDPDYVLTKGSLQHGCVLDPDCIHLFYPEEQKLYKLLDATKKTLDDHNIRFLFTMVPGDMQLYPDAAWKYNSSRVAPKGNENFLQKHISEFLTKEGISYVDYFDKFNKDRMRGYPYFPHDAHLNKLGNQLVAESLMQYLQGHNLLKK